jgi:hypothetical protein
MKQERSEVLINNVRMLENSLKNLEQQEAIVASRKNGKHLDKRIPRYQEEIGRLESKLQARS